MTLEEKKQKLEEIGKQVNDCQRCDLYKMATRGVPGDGNPDARVMCIGEGPGYHEDQQGLPFVGQAGKLLEQLLRSINLERKDVFIANVVKHRAPENRDPLLDEIEACSIWLDLQIEIIQPEFVVTLGRFSMAKFIPNVYISQVHGQPRFVTWQGREVTVVPMYHPAAALRAPQVMEAIKNDFLRLGELLSGKKEEEKVETEVKLEDNEQLDLL